MTAVGDARKRQQAAATGPAPKPAPQEVTVGVAPDPAGQLGVLLQLPNGWIHTGHASARAIADALVEAADTAEALLNIDKRSAALAAPTSSG